jgi:SAM-dependent methyltransferase
MDSRPSPDTGLLRTSARWWRDAAAIEGRVAATRRFLGVMWEFVRDSMPDRRRQRYGDMEFDWDYRVNTTSAAVGWRDRLLGVFHSEYQPTEPAAFHEMLGGLQKTLTEGGTSGLRDFTFVDLGSGKGRTLLMASDYPFRRIVGVELLPALDQIARENLRNYNSESQKCFVLESICANAAEFTFPAEPLVVYLFNPFPEAVLRKVMANLQRSLRDHPRQVYVLYHNPLLETVLQGSAVLRKVGGTDQYSMYSAASIGS